MVTMEKHDEVTIWRPPAATNTLGVLEFAQGLPAPGEIPPPAVLDFADICYIGDHAVAWLLGHIKHARAIGQRLQITLDQTKQPYRSLQLKGLLGARVAALDGDEVGLYDLQLG